MTMTGLDIEATYRDLIERLDPIERAKLAELLYHAVDDDDLTPTEIALRAAGKLLRPAEVSLTLYQKKERPDRLARAVFSCLSEADGQ